MLNPGSWETSELLVGERRIEWITPTVRVCIQNDRDGQPYLAEIEDLGGARVVLPEGLPLVDYLSVGRGHAPASDRLTHGSVSPSLRLVRSVSSVAGDTDRLVVQCRDENDGVEIRLVLEVRRDTKVIRSRVVIDNFSTTPIAVRAVPSWSSYLGAGPNKKGWELISARCDWLGENRWSVIPLDESVLPTLASELTGHNPRGSLGISSVGTWSTGRYLPTAFARSTEKELCWGWQIEHNGPWKFELGEDRNDIWLSLSGPTDQDHQFLEILSPGATFESVPSAIALGRDMESVADALTTYRRSSRRLHPDNDAMPVVFNDYMNTLNGDPSTDKLIPLIDAAAAAGAEIFCIDAGWYDDGGDWWDSVGTWHPSTTRFPRGLEEVTARIRDRGMKVGLWLEPEVVGVRSAVADNLPPDAFHSRAGIRIVEHERFFLDLRHPAARAHLDEVIDRLVQQFGVGYFKFDYNVTPGSGTDVGAASPGAALLEHSRAHLSWLDSLYLRHPELVIENCASGGMRSDFAMLSRLQLQSTSDQQDPMLYPPIAASSPLSMLPEQAASWAYPQPDMTLEEAAFALTTGLLGRYFVSGFLNRMDENQQALVAEAITVAKWLRADIRSGYPRLPLGLPGWDAPHVSLAIVAEDRVIVSVWDRAGGSEIALHLPDVDTLAPDVRVVFPTGLPAWSQRWVPGERTLYVRNPALAPGARTFELSIAP